MTIGSQVKQTFYSIKSAEQGLINLSIRAQDLEAQKVLYEAANILKEVVDDIDKRVGELERQEPQYKGF